VLISTPVACSDSSFAAPASLSASEPKPFGAEPMKALSPLSVVLAALFSFTARVAAQNTNGFNGQVDLTEVSLEQLMYEFKVQSVYAASRHEQTVSDAPSSVTIIDSDEIKKYGHRSFAEVLQSVRGLYVTYDRNYSYLGVRGFNRPGDYTSKVLVLVNGHRINENVFDSVLVGYDFPIDVEIIDRVEVVRGPSSSIYGNSAFFAVINVITKEGKKIDGLELSGSYGSFDSYKARATYGKKFGNDVELFLSGSFYDSAGADRLYYQEYNNPQNNFGVTRHTDYERFYKAFASLTYKYFTAEAAFSSREKGIPTGSYGTIFNDDRAKTTDNRAYLDLKYQQSFEEDWEVIARMSYDNYYYYGDYPIIYPPNYDVLYQDYAYGNWWGGDVQINKTILDRHRLTLGSEIRHNFNQDQGNKDNFVPRTVYDDHRETFNFAFYGQAETLLVTNPVKLILNAGVRYDHFETFGDTVNPRVAGIFSPWEKTTFKLLYGTAFKAPNAYELYYEGPNNKGNPGLKPETITTYEAVLEQALTRNLNFVVSGFRYEIEDLINQTVDPADGLLVYRNLDRVTAHGAEAELDAKFANGFRGRASYTYQETEDSATGEQLSNSPRHLAKLNLILPLWEAKIFSGIELQYTSSAKTLANRDAEEHLIANVTLFSQNIIKNLEFSASVYNVFNTTYFHPGAGEHLQDKIRQDGRTFRAKLTYRF
jgi:outer membrane receptor for ferrienterochelin and colicins